jgi:hypothetical protein
MKSSEELGWCLLPGQMASDELRRDWVESHQAGRKEKDNQREAKR